MLVKCVYAGRAQGALTKGNDYSVVERELNDAGVVVRYRVIDNHGKPKWYDSRRFIVLDEAKHFKVKCINTTDTSGITLGKSYDMILEDDNYYTIVNDSGLTVQYYKSHFIKITSSTDTTTKSEEKLETKGGVSMSKVEKPKTLREFLESQGVPSSLVDDLSHWRKEHGEVSQDVVDRLPKPKTLFFGGEVWTMALTALLEGQNVLLEGHKATGKNVLAENLAFAFGRPMWDVSFHSYTDAQALVGYDTFRNGEVEFNPGSVYNAAVYGGFCVLDEINMAKPDASAVLHSVLDDRRILDVPGHDRIKVAPQTRFIGTMNYGYMGTKELNEALVSRFVVISMPDMTEDELTQMLKTKFPNINDNITYVVKLWFDIKKKADNSEISTKAFDLRGFISALKTIQHGLKPIRAFEMGVINKAFDRLERDIVRDVVKTLIPERWESSDLFGEAYSITVDFSK